MRDDLTTQSVLFPSLGGKPVVARFDEAYGSSDGGAVLVKAVDQRLGLTARVAACVPDAREPGKVVHPLVDLVRQRVFKKMGTDLFSSEAAACRVLRISYWAIRR